MQSLFAAGAAGLLFRVETPNAKFTFALRMFEPLQRMSGKAQWLAGARGLPESQAEELSGIWEKMGRNLPKLLFLTLTITAARGRMSPGRRLAGRPPSAQVPQAGSG